MLHYRMNSRTLSTLFLLFALAGATTAAQAQASNCLDHAGTNAEIDQCGGSLVRHLEARMESDYKRLQEKFAGNEKMQEMIKASRENWEIYRNNQCLLEASAATGQYVVKPLSLEASKVYFKCMLRTFGEMGATLEKLRVNSHAGEQPQTDAAH